MYRRFFKRILDFIIATLMVIIASPILLIITLVLIVANQGKVFFVQGRIGLNNQSFRLFKFKTMNDRKDKQGILLPSHARLTKTGQFLRSTSLDELPQLINVIKGDMSLIGPRPLLIKYLPLYDDKQIRRHEVKPGITGWAQVNGRNAISWQQKFEYDVFYVDNVNCLLDLKIFFRTITKIFKREGINSDAMQTMEEFTGN